MRLQSGPVAWSPTVAVIAMYLFLGMPRVGTTPPVARDLPPATSADGDAIRTLLNRSVEGNIAANASTAGARSATYAGNLTTAHLFVLPTAYAGARNPCRLPAPGLASIGQADSPVDGDADLLGESDAGSTTSRIPDGLHYTAAVNGPDTTVSHRRRKTKGSADRDASKHQGRISNALLAEPAPLE